MKKAGPNWKHKNYKMKKIIGKDTHTIKVGNQACTVRRKVKNKNSKIIYIKTP